MSRQWTRFLFIKVLVSLLLLALVAEGLGWLLRNIPPSRHPLDQLVHALDHVHPDAPILLAGDSVTQDLANSYDLSSGSGRVANLTTNAASGMTGLLFVLRRYVSNNTGPRHLVLAATPYFIGFTPEGATYETYIRSVFTRDSERKWLQARGLEAGAAPWKPAVLRLKQSAVDRLIGGLRAVPASLPGGAEKLKIETLPELPGGNAVSAEELKQKYTHRDARIGPVAGTAIQDICRLLAEHGVAFHIYWAPIPETVYAEWRRTEYLLRMKAAIMRSGGPSCTDIRFGDFNRTLSYPDHGFRDPDHLRRPGWVTVYGRSMQAFLETLN